MAKAAVVAGGGDASCTVDLLLSDASSSSPSEDGFGSDVVFPAVQAQQHQLLQGDDDFGDFSADALLFLLEEEQEELLFTGLANEPLHLADLDFLSDATDDSSNDITNQVVAAPAPCAASTSQTTPTKTKTSITTRGITIPSTGPTGPKTSKGSRKRVKDELEYLRQHVNDLEDQLHQLKPKHAHFNSSSSQLTHCEYPIGSAKEDFPLVVTSVPAPSTSSSTLWKRVASHQVDERRKAEAENARLKDLLEAQLRLARSLARTLRKRPTLMDLDSERSSIQLRRLDPHGSAELSSIFTHLKESVDGLYNCVDTVLIEAGFSESKREVRNNQVKTDAMGRLLLEVVESHVLPFDLQTTSSSFWKLFSHASKEVCGACSLQAMDVTSDTVRTQFTMNLSMRHTDTALLLQGHMLGRRFIEENRVVIVWVGLGKSNGKLFGSKQVVVRETAWTVIEAIPPESTEDGEASSTSIKTVVRLTSDVGDLDLDADLVPESQSNHVGVLTELVLGSFRQNFGAMHKIIDNIVMVEMAALAI